MRIIFLFSFIVLCQIQVSAQPWWSNFCDGKYNYDESNSNTIKRVASSSQDPVSQAEASLVSAWGMLYQRNHPDSIINTLWYIHNDILPKNRNNDGVQSLLKEKCFVLKFRELLDSLRSGTYLTSYGYAKQKKADLLAKIAAIERSIPQYLKTCVDVSFKVSDDQRDLEFTIRIKDCEAELDNNGLPRGRVGYPDVYEALFDWYENSVLRDLDKNLAKERGSTTMEIKGLADGYMVISDLPLGFDMAIPSGKEYTYLGPDNIPQEAVLDIGLSDVIPLSSQSNKYLALSRACLAESRLSPIASKISIVAQEFEEQGDDYRGVEIKITAKGIIDELASAKFRESKISKGKRETMENSRF